MDKSPWWPSEIITRDNLQDMLSEFGGRYHAAKGGNGDGEKLLDCYAEAIDRCIQEEKSDAYIFAQDLDSSSRVYKNLVTFKGDSITDFMYSYAPEPYYNERLAAREALSNEDVTQSAEADDAQL